MSVRHILTRFLPSFLLFATCLHATAQSGMAIDHNFSDWNGLSSIQAADTTGPLESVTFNSDAERVYFRIRYDRLIALDEAIIPHGTKIALDVDGNPGSGQFVGAFAGADIVINLQDRYVNSTQTNGSTESQTLNASQVRIAPTYGGADHEIAIDRSINGLNSNAPLRWSVYCSTSGQQITPETASPLSNSPGLTVNTPIERTDGTAVRVAFWNMNRRLDNASARAAMARILQATQPDVIGMSEVEDFSAAQMSEWLNDWVPLETETWQVVKDDWDLMVASRWPITSTYPEVQRQFPVVIDAEAAWGQDFMLTASHLKCCNGADQRQEQADEYMAFLRNAMAGEGNLELAENTPVVYGGDLNMVGPGGAMHTLLTGDIQNEATYGPDFSPDWDGTRLSELPCIQTDQPMNYTWRNDYSEWPAGKLDYILVQDGAVRVLRSFALETASMSAQRLNAYGLESGDALEASDHFIVVADLAKHDRPGTKPVKIKKGR
jgi:endonuclease/exonuclease/phosphatase family metal-dependent hydrolase